MKEHPIKVAVVGLPLAVAGVGTAATVAGFGAAGIAGGSMAAAIQSSIGSVAAGSWFAVMQSLGMTGTFTAMTTGGIGASATGAAVLVATSGYPYRQHIFCQKLSQKLSHTTPIANHRTTSVDNLIVFCLYRSFYTFYGREQ